MIVSFVRNYSKILGSTIQNRGYIPHSNPPHRQPLSSDAVAFSIHAVLALLHADPVHAISMIVYCFSMRLRHLHSLALPALAVFALRVLVATSEGNAGEKRHHDDEKD